jgi:hypothetical protein
VDIALSQNKQINMHKRLNMIILYSFQLSQKLLFYVKGKKIEKAKILIDQGVGVTYTDEVRTLGLYL